MPSMTKSFEHHNLGLIFDKLSAEIGSPVEFELPDWVKVKDQNPNTYTFIKRNVYLSKKLKRRFDDDDGIFCSCKASSESTVCGRDCQCGMLLSTCSPNCDCGSSCLNVPFHQRPAKKLKLVKTEKCGSGLVAEEDIKRKEFVIEYVGEVIDDKTCEERLWDMKHRGETNFYLCEVNRDMVIDATYKGNKSRFINHSCRPNTEMQKWTDCGETRIGIFATRNIKKGEHLTYDYQFVQFGADQECHCGASDCRKHLGAKPIKLNGDLAVSFRYKTKRHASGYTNKDLHIGSSQPNGEMCSHSCIGEIVRIFRTEKERGPLSAFGIIKKYDNNSKKHTILFEDGVLKILDLSKVEWEFCNIAISS
ncbi:hypothetical protein MKW94_016405 [Papaver nudicaule]|uniref:Histone-lysine N-methyltransferase ASHH3 n=1 Tax=Papaver nudicaule TaxID=74823 RepID=A0AA41VQ00_PAPNU|nr:hypothetical protein [Papaver nudicaule]